MGTTQDLSTPHSHHDVVYSSLFLFTFIILASVIALFCTYMYYDYYDSYKLRKSTFVTFDSCWLVWPFKLAA